MAECLCGGGCGGGGRFTRESIEFSESYFKRVNGYLENFEVFV